MATIELSKAFDFSVDYESDWKILNATSSLIELGALTKNIKISFFGSYAIASDTATGTITSIDFKYNGSLAYTVTGINWDLQTFADYFYSSQLDAYEYAFTSADSVIGSKGSDVLGGWIGDDTIDGGDGTDTMYYLYNSSAYSWTHNSDGSLTVIGPEDTDLLRNIEHLRFSDTMIAVESGSGGDPSGESLTGTDVSDTLAGGTGADTIQGGAGDDSLYGGDGADIIYGGDGADILDGGTGADRMEGGAGPDTYYVDTKKDVVFEENNLPAESSGLVLKIDLGNSIDTVISSVKYTLTNYVENLTLVDSTKKLAGTGNELGNEITGNSGSNKLTGQAGNDTIDGGAGADKISGGTGVDIFVFANLAQGGADAISDFTEEDFLEFDTSVFTSLVGVSADNYTNYLNVTKGVLSYDADGTGSSSAIKIVALKGSGASSVSFDDLSFL
jgi:Ca2+-binding RTX toxin-like protein